MLACFILRIERFRSQAPRKRKVGYQVIAKYTLRLLPCLMIGYKLGYDFTYNFF